LHRAYPPFFFFPKWICPLVLSCQYKFTQKNLHNNLPHPPLSPLPRLWRDFQHKMERGKRVLIQIGKNKSPAVGGAFTLFPSVCFYLELY
jgi:hypothetical protein